MPGYVALPAYRAPSGLDFSPLNEGIDSLAKQFEKNRLLREAQQIGATLAPDTATQTTPNALMAQPSVPASPAQASAAAAGRDFPTSGTDYSPAIKGIESGGNYKAVGPVTASGDRAYGAHQVMGANIPVWTKEVLGQSLTPQQYLDNPDAQEKVFRAKFGQYVAKTGNPQDAASMWFTGKPLAQGANRQDLYGTTGNEYVRRFNAASGGGTPSAAAAPAQAASGPNYRAAAAKAFSYGNVALGTQFLQQQQELDNTAYARSHQAQQEAIGEQHWQAGNTRAEASAGREAQAFDEAQQKALEQKFGVIAQTIATEPDPAKQKGMVDQLLSSHPEIAPNLQKYGVPINDPAAVTKFLLAEAQGIVTAQKPQFTQIGEDQFGNKQFGWADPNTRTATPAQGVAAPSAAPGLGDLHGEDFLKTLPTPLADQVKAYVDGRLAFPGGFALSKPYFKKMIQLVSQYDPNFDAVNYNARSKTRNDFTAGKSAQNITSFNTAIGHLGTLDKAIDGLNNSNYPYWNDITNFAAKQSGDTRFQKAESDFNAAKNAVVDELTRAFRGSGGSVHDIEGWEAQLKSAGSPATLHQAVKQAVELLRSRIEAVGDQYNRGMGTTADPLTLLNPKAQETIKRLSGEAAPAGSASIPQGAIDLLRKDPSPDAVKEFNEVFGPDASRQALGR